MMNGGPGRDADGNFEELALCVGHHPTMSKGRSFANGKIPKTEDDYGFSLDSGAGKGFEAQFNAVMYFDPEIVLITGWNEWGAGLSHYNDEDTFAGSPARGFQFVDQFNTEYSRDAEPMRINSTVYEDFLHESGFRAIRHLTIAKKLFAAVHAGTSADAMSVEQKTAYARCWQDYENLRTMFDMVDQFTQAHYDSSVKLTDEESRTRSEYYKALRDLEAKLKESGNALNELFGNPISPRWDYSSAYWYQEDGDVNEVYVDFR